MTKRLVMLLALALFATACKRRGSEEGAPKPVTLAAPDIATVERTTIQTGPRVLGSLEARERAVVRAEVGGPVLNVNAEVGDVVKRGQLLGRIQDRALRDAYASAKSAVRSAETAYDVARRQAERTAQLVRGGALAQRELETAESQAESARAQVEQARSQLAAAQENLEAASIVAPIDGVVSERSIGEGDVVAVGGNLFTIIEPQSMRLEASVPSEELRQVYVGAPVVFHVRGYGEQEFVGMIERVAPAADPVTRQIPILVSIPNPEGKLVAGLFADGRVASQSKETLVLPLSAINAQTQQPSVKRITHDVVEEVEVEIGLRDETNERVEISAGLRRGDRVLNGSARAVPAGTRVSTAAPSDEARPKSDGAEP